MKIAELKNMTIKELNSMLEEKRVELSKLRMELKLGRSNSVHAMKNLKKEVARIVTELNLRRLSA